MGACAGCVGPNRRAELYKVNRLAQDSPIRKSVSQSELPISRHKDKIIQELQQSKKRMDHNNNLVGPLLTSLAGHQDSPLNQSKSRLTSSALYQKQKTTDEYAYRDRGLSTSSFNIGLNRVESKYPDQNTNSRNNRRSSYQKQQTSLLVFDKPIVQSKILHRDNSFNPNSSPYQKQLKTSTTYALERQRSPSRQLYKEPLSQHRTNTKLGQLQRSTLLKSNKLLNIPELPEEESKTPMYVTEIRKQNGEDVKKTGLKGIPRKLESVATFALHQYLKDLL